VTPRRSSRARLWKFAAVLATLVALAVVLVAGSNANLNGSKFEANDGNLAVDTAGNLDWNALSTAAGADPRLNVGVEQFSGQQDNSFGQGTKEDNSNVTLVQGSIPPQKSDLTRFYEASQVISGYGDGSHVLLYLAWERSNVLGSANMDFEINKVGTPCLSSTGPFPVACTITRSTGDILVTYDFTNGGGTPTVGIRTWNGSSWQLDSTVVAESAVSTGTVHDSHANVDLAANTFGEAAIDLTASGVLGAGSCGFGQATTFLASRSSASFTSEIKDFVSPIATPINPCSSITIVKRTLNGAGTRSGIDQSFGYTTTGSGLSAFSLNDKAGVDTDGANMRTFGSLGPGSYSVSETLPVTGFTFVSLICTSSGSGTSASTSDATASITLGFGGSATCTYTNRQQVGALKITKTSIKGPPLSGATFSISGPGGYSNSVTTGGDGTVCVAGLVFGTYSVQETAAPSGYAIDDASSHDVAVGSNSVCGDGNEATFAATDTPLTDIAASATSEVSGGTSSTVTCVDASNANVGNSPQSGESASVAAVGLRPGVYTCTIVVDP